MGSVDMQTKTQIRKKKVNKKEKIRQGIVIQSKAKKHITQIIQDYYKVKAIGYTN